MSNLFSLAEEGHLAPEDATHEAAIGVNPSVEQTKKGGSRKREPLQVQAAEPTAPVRVAQKSQGTEEVVVANPATKIWCPVHESDNHNAHDCRTMINYNARRDKRWMSRWRAGPLGTTSAAISSSIMPKIAPRKSALEPSRRSAGAMGEETLLMVRHRGVGWAAETHPLLRAMMAP
jgi:hypothetical protein